MAVWEWTIILLISSWSHMLSFLAFFFILWIVLALIREEWVCAALARITFRHGSPLLFLYFRLFVWVCAGVAWQGIHAVLGFIQLFVVAATHVVQSLRETVKNLLFAADYTTTIMWFPFNVLIRKSKPIWVLLSWLALQVCESGAAGFLACSQPLAVSFPTCWLKCMIKTWLSTRTDNFLSERVDFIFLVQWGINPSQTRDLSTNVCQ